MNAQAEFCWRKSTYSGGDSNNCVEVAALQQSIAVRDSKNPDGGMLLVSARQWQALTELFSLTD